ncbi:zinc finger protein, putative, partial [Schistosoma mansoni]|uniref:zinc finger protein, putative n=1 Tax=Schistosoma mansoni TaxID=6183 RepID=UPI00022C8735
MFLLINANIKLSNSSTNPKSRKLYTKHDSQVSNPYSQYPNIGQSIVDLNKIDSNNLNIKNYMNKSAIPDLIFQQQKTKNLNLNTSLGNPLDKSWNDKDNLSKLSGKRYHKKTNISLSEESMKSAFSYVSSPKISNDCTLISSHPNYLNNHATEYSNDNQQLKQMMNGVQGQLEPAHMIETSPAREGYTCDRCGKMFAYQYYRDKHLKYTRCMDQGDRKYPCKLCSRSFEKRDRLRIHVLHVHEKHRPHKCHLCGKNFSQSSSLNKHLRVSYNKISSLITHKPIVLQIFILFFQISNMVCHVDD